MSTASFRSLVNIKKKGVWRYEKLLGNLAPECIVESLQKKCTPLEKISDIWLKREDLSPTGSHKFRSLVYQLSYLRSKNIDWAVLSSSGNAAISASYYAQNAGVRIFIFLSDKTPNEKLIAIRLENIVPIISSRPLRLAKYAIKHFRLPDLRPSQDSNAVLGFETLGFELFEQNRKINNIFSFATSFASLQGMQSAYKKLLAMGIIKKIPRFYAVVGDKSLADKLRKQTLDSPLDEFEIVYSTDAEILSTRQHFLSVQLSPESIASLSAYRKTKPFGESAVISTGRLWPKQETRLIGFEQAENFEDVDKIVARYA